MRKAHVPDDPQAMEMIDAYIEHLRRLNRSDYTIRTRRGILGQLDRDLPQGVGRTTKEELSVWLYRDGLSQNSKAAYHCALKSFYTWAADPDDPWIDGNPAAKLEPVKFPPGRARPVTDEQLRRILTESPKWLRTWSKLAAYNGLRCVEISRLDREHVTERQLIVMRGKGGYPRAHDTDPAVWDAVKDLPPGPIAIHPRRGGRATPYEVSLEAALYFRRKLDMPGVGLHRLRHWLGVSVQREYRDIRVTQAILGHRSLSSTQIYTDATDEQQRAARATLPRFSTGE